MLRQTEISTDAVTLEWEAPKNYSNYSYLVETTNGSVLQSETVVTQHKVITGLLSGTNYNFTVTTLTPNGTQAAPVTVSYFTRPYSVGQVESKTLNTTAVRLLWMKPPEYKPEYTYQVKTTDCRSQNLTLAVEEAWVSGLPPGTNCTFCVFVRAADGIEGSTSCTSQYTKPEAVQPHISSLGSNSSILVSWSPPHGNVEFYTVHLNSTPQALRTLNSSNTSVLFHDLSAGKLYTAVVITCSGHFNASSEFITNATYPNPPGSISDLTKTTSSIGLRWNEAPLMTAAMFHYQLTYTSPQGEENTTTTSNTSHSLTSLLSGTSYNISIATVGAMGFNSEKVHIYKVTTRPLSVKLLKVSTREEGIVVTWEEPDEYKESYQYNLTWQSTDGPISHRLIRENMSTLDNLDPGKQYNISVTTETEDETKGAPRWISTCTKASPARNVECYGPNTTNAHVILTCNIPDGQYSGFEVTVKDGEINTTHTCNHTVANLRHNTQYFLSVTTESCGPPSTAVSLPCWTGITNPPIPEDYGSLVVVSKIEYNKFNLKVKTSLLSSVNGPITHVGVMVTDGYTGDISEFDKFVGKTYKQWQEDDTPVYMATVVENSFLSRSGDNLLNIEIGDQSQWKGYTNGALEANGKYQYAIVLFTSLELQDDLVNGQRSLLSITNFFAAVPLPQNPGTVFRAKGFCYLLLP
ncbi:Receptor-type tyrosine-protein phosphatase eta [Liparis tanakae]|uniref:protein-tyrosine-phosphatase n=1 Tax=Liparis tanakae TaxID=230148 RepID=A0A4Z2JCV6_9TELE|nr:Receptor-type tyrosine-protein phosphatase eta [Liparis tanakae]